MIFILGDTSKHPGQLYLQTGNGGFVKKEEPAFKQFSTFEDVAVLFFDCDNDGDLDLFIGAGEISVCHSAGSCSTGLFKNDGKGNFQLIRGCFSDIIKINIGALHAYDFDQMATRILFVGGQKCSETIWSNSAQFMFINDGKGHFTDMPADKILDIADAGMVTGAVGQILIGDKAKELIITGEWMSPQDF